MPARSQLLSTVCSASLLAGAAHAQAPALPSRQFTPWRPAAAPGNAVVSRQVGALKPGAETTRSGAVTGLLVGSIVGVAATGVFLALFCGDPDTSCGADEVGRAAIVLVPPPAILGALIGSLGQSDD